MNRIGFVDDLRTIDPDIYPKYQKKFEKKGLTLLSPTPQQTKEALVQWIQENNICSLLVDYKLDSEYAFSGTDLVAYINSVLPDLPCIILTAFRGQSIGEHLVIKPMIRDRDIFTDSKEFNAFADELQHAAQVYTKRLGLHEAEYAQLLAKKEREQLSVKEEERFLALYKLLRDYGIVDELPEQLLRPEIEQKMDAMLDQLRTLVKETSNSEGDN